MRNNKTFILLSTSILFFSGCAERGYQLTVQPSTHTAVAQTTTDLNANIPQKSTDTYNKMKQAVKKELRKTKKPDVEHTPSHKNKKLKKLAIEKPSHDNKHVVRTPAETKSVSNRAKEELTFHKEKTPTADSAKKIAQEIERPIQRTKRPVEEVKKTTHKQENTSAPQIEKPMSLEEEIALSLSGKQINKSDSKAKEDIHAPLQTKQTQTRDIKPSKSLPSSDVSIKTTKESRPSSVPKTTAQKETKVLVKPHQKNIYKPVPEKATHSTSRSINFQHIGKTYYKFGTSEIHGHIIYLNKQGDEIPLQNVHIYLLPKNATLDNWYRIYYLKNKTPIKPITMGYIHKTDPDLEKNFGFYGVPEGKYYAIIVADDPNNKNAKIYIAKKLDIGKYKKIMAVFSKRL